MFSRFFKRSIFILSLFVLFVLPACHQSLYQKNVVVKGGNVEQQNLTKKVKKKDPVEFEFTKKELEEIGRWNNKSTMDLSVDATSGDKSALYTLGMFHVMGYAGFDLDMETADYFLSFSASLGFPPALYQVAGKYIEEENPFLSLVYYNLVAAEGHCQPDLICMYHKAIDNLPISFREKVRRAVERIASYKRRKICENKKYCKANPGNFVIFKIYKLTKEDILFDRRYWERVFNGTAPDNIQDWVNEANNYYRVVKHEAAEARARTKSLPQ